MPGHADILEDMACRRRQAQRRVDLPRAAATDAEIKHVSWNGRQLHQVPPTCLKCGHLDAAGFNGHHDFTCASGFKPTVARRRCDVPPGSRPAWKKLALRFGTRICCRIHAGACSQWQQASRASPGRRNEGDVLRSSLPTKPPWSEKLTSKGDHEDGDQIGIEQNKAVARFAARPRRQQPHQVHLSLICGVRESFNTWRGDDGAHGHRRLLLRSTTSANPADYVAFVNGHDTLRTGEDTLQAQEQRQFGPTTW